MTSSPLGSFSMITVGAPIMADGTTRLSSAISSSEHIWIGPYSCTDWIAINIPIYGSPPPPVPSTAAPMARSWMFCTSSIRMSFLQRQVAHGLDVHANGVAGQVRQRHLVHLDDLDAVRHRAGCQGLVQRVLLGLRQRLLARQFLQRKDTVGLT